jgi:hypothetical protein
MTKMPKYVFYLDGWIDEGELGLFVLSTPVHVPSRPEQRHLPTVATIAVARGKEEGEWLRDFEAHCDNSLARWAPATAGKHIDLCLCSSEVGMCRGAKAT